MEKLIELGIINTAELNQARYLQRLEGGLVGEKLIELGFIDEHKMKNFASRVLDEI
jgi:hypothetical protein